MFARLLLLLIYHWTIETTTVTLTEDSWPDMKKYPWPASGTFRVSVNCSTELLRSTSLYFFRGTDYREGGNVNWFPNNERLKLVCKDGTSSLHSFRPECSEEGLVTYIVQWLTDKIRVFYKGEMVAERQRDGLCLPQPDGWRLTKGGKGYGRVTVSDEYILRTTDEGWHLLSYFLKR